MQGEERHCRSSYARVFQSRIFYNGAKSRKDTRWNHDEIEMKLSDCFLGAGEDISDENEPERFPNLELKVRVLNINRGYNAELLEKCKVLNE